MGVDYRVNTVGKQEIQACLMETVSNIPKRDQNLRL
jgi:hypothetical protein